MDPVENFIEKRAAVFTEKSAFVERDKRTAMVIGGVADSLPVADVLDDTVVGAAVRAEPLFGSRQIQGDEVIVPESVHLVDGGFPRKAG